MAFIIDHGRKEQGNVYSWALSWGKLERLSRHPNDLISGTAKNLVQITYDNPNKLIHDEVSIVRDIGIDFEVKPSNIKYYHKTRRVTAVWQAHTPGLKEAIKLGIITPPNDFQKE